MTLVVQRERRTRRTALPAARVALMAGPTVLGFFAGGYFAVPRAWAGLVAWCLAALGFALTRVRARAQPLGVRLAVAGLAGLAVWTLLSILWAPIAGSAYAAGQIALLYLGGLLAAWLLLDDHGGLRAVEPAVVAGTLVVIGYGLSERFLPGLLHFARSVSAEGRLEQPLTYWNAIGEVAAIGLVVAIRVAGDTRRERWLRAGAAAAAAPLGLGLYTSFSRGALFAAVAGLITLAVIAPERAQLRALAIGAGAAVLAAAAGAPLGGVTNLHGALGTREIQGAAALAAIVLLAAVAAALQWHGAVSAPAAPRLRLPRHARWIALAAVTAGLAVAIVAGAHERSGVPLAGGASRLTTLQSNRYDYWHVALIAFAHDPLIGVGAGGWAVYWLRDRPYADGATDAHSLELQTLAELGLVGIALLGAFLGGVGLAARDALRRAPAAAAGPVAGCVVYLTHSPLDWDWQMPAVTLIAILLAGAVLALAGAPSGATAPPRPGAPRD